MEYIEERVRFFLPNGDVALGLELLLSYINKSESEGHLIARAYKKVY